MVRVLLLCSLLLIVPTWSIADDAAPAVEPIPLNPAGTVLLDKPGGRVLVKTTVCLRQGVLEMLVCPKQTKEHESILSFDGKSQVIHTGLLALGMKPGHPARFGEQFELPEGPELELNVVWTDAAGKEHRRPANSWIRYVTYRYFAAHLDAVPPGVIIDKGDDTLRFDPNTKELLWYGTMTAQQKKKFLAFNSEEPYRKAVESLYDQSQPKQVECKWIFAGSSFAKTPEGKEIYLADSGSLVCVANFSDALIDVSMESSASDGGQLFEPYEDRIPPIETPVTLEISLAQKPELEEVGKKTPGKVE